MPDPLRRSALHPRCGSTLRRLGLSAVLGAGLVLSAAGPALAAAPVVSFTGSTAAAGEFVTINGTDFATATHVAINGTSVPFSHNTASQMFAQIPDDATAAINGPVSVTNPDGTGTSSGSVTLAVAPDVTSVYLTRRADGYLLVVNGVNFTGVTDVKVSTVSVPFTLANSRRIYVPVASPPGSVPVVVTTPAGADTLSGGSTFVLINGVAPGSGPQFDVGTGTANPVQLTSGSYTGISGISYKNRSFLSSFPYYLDRGVGLTVGTIAASPSTITTPLALTGANEATLAGNFPGSTGNQIDWTGTYSIQPGSQDYVTTFTFTAASGALGAISLRPRMDEDVFSLANDIAATLGDTADNTFTAFMIDGPERFGYGISGTFVPTAGRMANATYDGYAIGRYNLLSTRITGRTQAYSTSAIENATTPPGNINTTEMPASVDATLGTVYGGVSTDAGASLSWTVDPSATTATITVILRNQSNSPSSSMNLSVAKSGTGTGSVVAGSGALDCGATCADDYAFGATVTLTAAAAAGSTFEGWEDGPCTGTTPTCAVSMTQAQSVTARFSVPPVITPPTTPDPVAPVAPVTPDPPAADPVAALSGPITRAVTPTGVVLTAPLQLPEIGRYTFTYLTTQGRRAAILRGSTIGARSLAKRFSAPVLTTTTAASNVKLVVRLRGTAPKNLTLRVVRKDADGSLHDVLLK